MNEMIYNLASHAGATTVHGTSIDKTTDVHFSHNEFEDFIIQLVKFQMNELNAYAKHEQDCHTYMEDDVPASVMVWQLKKIMGIE